MNLSVETPKKRRRKERKKNKGMVKTIICLVQTRDHNDFNSIQKKRRKKSKKKPKVS